MYRCKETDAFRRRCSSKWMHHSAAFFDGDVTWERGKTHCVAVARLVSSKSCPVSVFMHRNLPCLYHFWSLAGAVHRPQGKRLHLSQAIETYIAMMLIKWLSYDFDIVQKDFKPATSLGMQAAKTAKTASTGTKTATKAKKKAGLRVSPWAIWRWVWGGQICVRLASCRMNQMWMVTLW